MPLVHLVIVLVLLQFLYFGIQVGRARERYNVPAPATTGNELFERHFRVQMNTLEMLLLFLPALVLFAHYYDPRIAAGLGVLFIIGRFLYAAHYVRNPKGRSLGFGLTALPTLILLGGALIGSVRAAVG